MEFLAPLGEYSLIFALCMSLLLSFSGARMGIFIYGQFSALVFAMLCLVLAFYFSVFSVKLVHDHSYSGSPWFYKIAAMWGNHEGSMLLWVLVLSICSVMEFNLGKNRTALVIQSYMVAAFTAYVLFTSNPFEVLPFAPGQGQGLNPLLRDVAMTFHPPLLYAGYVGLSMVFSYGVAFMVSKRMPPHEWVRRMSFWCSFAWIFLTLGVAAGSYWAYYELGWGGFWFWDPVENASIMPWLMATAMLHMLRVAAKKQGFYNWIVLFAIVSFSFSVMGTFLVRSGLLVSVHAFASDPLRGLALLVILSFMLVSSLGLFALRWKDFTRGFTSMKGQVFMLSGIWVLVIVSFTILLGTLYPIGLELVTGERISVGAPYFQRVLFPFLVLSIVLMSFAANRRGKFLLAANFLGSGAATAVIGLWVGGSWVGLASLCLGFWAGLCSVLRMRGGSVIIRKMTPMAVSHIGFATCIIAISAQTWEGQKQDLIEVGETMSLTQNSYLNFQKVLVEERGDYVSVKGYFTYHERANKVNLNPEVRYFYPSGVETTEVALSSNLFRDLYLVMKRADESRYLVEFRRKPFLIWIWIGALIMAAGGVLALARHLKAK